MNELMRKKFLQVIKSDDIDSFKNILNEYSLASYEDFNKKSIFENVGYYNAIKICKYIHTLGVSLDHVYYEFEETCLHKAVSNGHEELTTWLLENGANPNGNLLSNGTPISSVLYMIGRILLKEISVVYGNENEVKSGYGKLESIATNPEYYKYKRLITKLLENDADPNIMIHSLCKTPLDYCFTYNYESVSSILKDYGAGYARLDINNTNKKDNQVLLSINENIGQVLSVYFKFLPVTEVELMITLISSDTKLKLLITNGLNITELNSEIGFVVDTYLPITQQIIDDNYSYSFFEKLPLLIAKQVYNLEIKLFEGLIIEPDNFPTLQFPNNLNALMFISKQIDIANSIWLLVPIKYPRSRKFTPATLDKFTTGLKKKKWHKLAYMLEKDDECNYIPIFK